MSSTTTVVKTKHRSTSSASQKFWPLKKFGLHHGKAEEQQQSIPLSSTATIKDPSPVVEPAKGDNAHVEKDAQKKTKNKRLSSLLSSRRQEANSNNNFQNLKSHVNTPESIAADNTKKQISNASNTPTLTRKTGREISHRARTSSPNIANTTVPKNNNNNMTAKSAGSGTLSRSNNTVISSTTTPSASPLNNNNKTRTKELRNNSVRRSSEDKLLKRPQSPPSKRNNSPTQPNIMLESVQQKIQQEQLNKDDIDNDFTIEEDTEKDENISKKDTASVEVSTVDQKPINVELDSNEINEPKLKSTLAQLKPDTKEKEEENNQTSFEENEKNIAINEKEQTQTPLPSPPITPAATEIILSDFTIGDSSEAEATNTATSILNIHSEPVSPTLCTFDIQLVQQKANEIDKQQHILNNTFTQQQSIQRIHRLRPAASFATLRQLANTNNTYLQQQLQQQQQLPIQQVQKTKRRPVSYIEPTNNTYFSYTNDDYLTVNRPTCYRRASSEDNRHFHTRQQSDSNTSPPIQHHVGSRKLVRSNTVHNIIIKDGLGHRIVQCIGLDEPASKNLRKKTSSFESNDSIQNLDWSPPPEALDDKLFITRQQQLEEQQYHQQQLLLIQQQQQQQSHNTLVMNDNNNLDTSSSDSSSHRAIRNRRIKRRDSAKSISSLCSGSPPNIHYDSRFTKLKNKLEKERATVKALQKQKEACNKDVIFLSKNVDNLTTENAEWKKKYENEKTFKERFQDDLSSTMDKLSEATEQIRQLENQTKILKLEIDDKNKEIRELEKKKQSSSSKAKSYSEGKSTDRLLASQLAHSQNQVRLLKSTMEQFLRMGVFNDDLNSSSTSLTSPTISIDAILPDINKCVVKSRQQKRNEVNKSSTSSTTTEDASTSTSPPKSKKSKVPTTDDVNTVPNKATKTPEKKPSQYQDEATAELDIQLRELLREKEILQAEYSKAPSSGGNALVRRRREELESRLDTVDSQMCRIKLKMRSRNIL